MNTTLQTLDLTLLRIAPLINAFADDDDKDIDDDDDDDDLDEAGFSIEGDDDDDDLGVGEEVKDEE